MFGKLSPGGGPRRTQGLAEGRCRSWANAVPLSGKDGQLFTRHPTACPALGRAGPLSGSGVFGFNEVEAPQVPTRLAVIAPRWGSKSEFCNCPSDIGTNICSRSQRISLKPGQDRSRSARLAPSVQHVTLSQDCEFQPRTGCRDRINK